jgi:hypothetical protein
MNLIRHFDVLKRGRAIIAVGLLVAISLAIFATFKVTFSGGPNLSYRKPETWSSTTKLLLTQPGFPWGRSVLPGGAALPDGTIKPEANENTQRLQFADPSRLAYLAWIYSHFLMGDEVRTMLKDRPPGMDIEAGPLTAGGNMSAASLPIIGLKTSAESAGDARRLNDQVHLALEDYLTRQQRRSGTPTTDRVVISTVDRPDPIRLKGHSINLGVMAFLLIMVATISLVYMLENLRLHRREAEAAESFGEQRLFSAQDPLGDPRLAGTGARPLGDQRTSAR